MRTTNQISLIHKSFYGIMLLGLFLATFSIGGFSTAYAQQVATPVPTVHAQVNPPVDGENEAPNVELGPQNSATPNVLDSSIQSSSLSIPYLSEWTGAPTQHSDCGPAAVGMIAMAYGKHPIPTNQSEEIAFIADIRAKMGVPTGGTGNQQRINGLAAYGIGSTAITSSPLQTIEDAIAQGRPSIARVWGHTLARNYDGHVVVVLGFSDDFGTIYVHDPDSQITWTATPGGANQAWPTSTFEAAMGDAYDGSNYYGLVINDSLLNYSATYVSQSPYPTVTQGQSVDLSVTFRNIGTSTWSNAGSNPTRIGTTNPANNAIDFFSPFTCPTWVVPYARPANLSDASVAPGGNGTFNFKICVPSDIAPGTYRISVAPLVEGITWMFQPEVMVYWDITVTRPDYSAIYVNQSPYPTVAQGQSVDLSVTFQNTGNLIWNNTGSNPTRLGTTDPVNNGIDFFSPFTCPTWVVPYARPTNLAEASVAPGSNGTFNFKICAPSDMAPGTYRISVAPLVEGIAWMFQPGVTVYWDITVTQPLSATFSSIAAQDGWILECSEISGTGCTMNSTSTTFNLGDDATKKQYRGILSFSTGGLPDNAVITKVTLKLQKSAIVGGGNPVTMFGGFMVDIKNGFFGTAAMLQAGDFQAAGSKTYGPFAPAPVSNWYSIDLTSAKAYVNKLATGSGLTQIRLRFKLDDNNNTVANYLSLFSGNAPAASRPQLIVTYYVP